MGPLGIKGFEWVIILIVILLIFGPKNLPKLGKAIGKTFSSLREGMSEGKKSKAAAENAEDAAQEGADDGGVFPLAGLGPVQVNHVQAAEAQFFEPLGHVGW